MTRELFWLTLTVIFTGLLWIPYILMAAGMTLLCIQIALQIAGARRQAVS